MKRIIVFSIAVIAACAQAQDAPAPATRSVTPGVPGRGAPTTILQPVTVGRAGSYSASGSAIPPIVLRFSSTDPAEVRELSEDLDVMSHLIEQSVAEARTTDGPQTKMGIPMYYTSSSRSVRAMYVEDFGPLFMVKVDFPLQGPASPKAKEPEKSADTEWDRARAAVLGLSDPNQALELYHGGQEFDSKQVDRLKTAFSRVLKNASNIRHLKASDNYVSISIFGSGAPITVAQSERPAPKAALNAYGTPPGEARFRNAPVAMAGKVSAAYAQGTVLTMLVRKSNIDAFAKNDDFEAFAQTITFNNYVGAGHDVTSVNSWANDPPRTR